MLLVVVVVIVNVMFNDCQFVKVGKYCWLFVFICQQLLWGGGEVKFVKQLFLCQVVGDNWEDIVVDECWVVGQFVGEGGFWLVFNFCCDDVLLEWYCFWVGFQVDWLNGDVQWFVGLVQYMV